MNIIYCTESTFKSLGYQPIDLLCLKLSSLVYARDRSNFEKKLSSVKNEIIESHDKKSKNFSITCRMMKKKNGKNEADKYHLVRIIGTIEYREDLLVKDLIIEKAKNTHLSIRSEESWNHESAILIRGSIGLIEDPDSLSAQINYILLNTSEYRLAMDPNGNIIYACHRMVNINGYQSGEVCGRYAYEYIHSDDRAMSLCAHIETLTKGRGTIVHRLLDVKNETIYLEVTGGLEISAGTPLFLANATKLSEEEGERRRQEYKMKLAPKHHEKSIEELMSQIQVVGQTKIAQMMNELAPTKIHSNVNSPANSSSTETSLQTRTSSFSSPNTSSSLGPASVSTSQASFSSTSHFSTPSTTSSSLPTLSSSPALKSPSTQLSSYQSPLSQYIPIQSSISQVTSTKESISTQFSSDSSSTLLSTPLSTTISINYPAYSPQIIMRSTNEHLIQNQYYQLGGNHCNIIITTQTYPEQPTLFSQPINHQIILQPTSFSQCPSFNYQNDEVPMVQNVFNLGIDAELQKVDVNDFIHQLDSDSEDVNK